MVVSLGFLRKRKEEIAGVGPPAVNQVPISSGQRMISKTEINPELSLAVPLVDGEAKPSSPYECIK
jgi:hypothetical protein